MQAAVLRTPGGFAQFCRGPFGSHHQECSLFEGMRRQVHVQRRRPVQRRMTNAGNDADDTFPVVGMRW
ncbi:MAG TPA: hypothetical protein VFB14_19465 [Bryobacteraceae bacterium]|nr:hypothetical protein [Bryobacteraceae bacterium]